MSRKEGSSVQSEALSHSVNEARLAGEVKSTEMHTEGSGEVSPWQKAYSIHSAHAGNRGSPCQRIPFLSIAFYQEVPRPGFAPSALRRPTGSWCKPAGASWESAGLHSASLFHIAQSPAEITVLLESKLLIFCPSPLVNHWFESE